MVKASGLRCSYQAVEEPARGCFNQAAQDPNYGKPFDEAAEEKIFEELDKDWCKGLSFLGGEPLSKLSDNRKTVIAFAEKVKKKYPDKDIWLWSGYTYEEISSSDDMKGILNWIDYLIDGPFVESLKDISLKWKGSSNQRVIDVKKTLAEGKVVEAC